MSSPVYNVSVAGHNNDTDLILQSAGASITDNGLDCPPPYIPEVPEPLKNIIDTAVATSNLSKLVESLTSADLVSSLAEVSFTVLAPVNGGFDSLATILPNLDPSIIKDVLLSHVISGTVMSSDLSHGMVVPTLGSLSLNVEISGNVVEFVAPGSKAKVMTADVKTTNGVVHLIDSLLLPVIGEHYKNPQWNLLSSMPLGGETLNVPMSTNESGVVMTKADGSNLKVLRFPNFASSSAVNPRKSKDIVEVGSLDFSHNIVAAKLSPDGVRMSVRTTNHIFNYEATILTLGKFTWTQDGIDAINSWIPIFWSAIPLSSNEALGVELTEAQVIFVAGEAGLDWNGMQSKPVYLWSEQGAIWAQNEIVSQINGEAATAAGIGNAVAFEELTQEHIDFFNQVRGFPMSQIVSFGYVIDDSDPKFNYTWTQKGEPLNVSSNHSSMCINNYGDEEKFRAAGSIPNEVNPVRIAFVDNSLLKVMELDASNIWQQMGSSVAAESVSMNSNGLRVAITNTENNVKTFTGLEYGVIGTKWVSTGTGNKRPFTGMEIITPELKELLKSKNFILTEAEWEQHGDIGHFAFFDTKLWFNNFIYIDDNFYVPSQDCPKKWYVLGSPKTLSSNSEIMMHPNGTKVTESVVGNNSKVVTHLLRSTPPQFPSEYPSPEPGPFTYTTEFESSDIQITLQGKKIKKIVIYTENAYVKDLLIEVSQDNKVWTPIYYNEDLALGGWPNTYARQYPSLFTHPEIEKPVLDDPQDAPFKHTIDNLYGYGNFVRCRNLRHNTIWGVNIIGFYVYDDQNNKLNNTLIDARPFVGAQGDNNTYLMRDKNDENTLRFRNFKFYLGNQDWSNTHPGWIRYCENTNTLFSVFVGDLPRLGTQMYGNAFNYILKATNDKALTTPNVYGIESGYYHYSMPLGDEFVTKYNNMDYFDENTEKYPSWYKVKDWKPLAGELSASSNIVKAISSAGGYRVAYELDDGFVYVYESDGKGSWEQIGSKVEGSLIALGADRKTVQTLNNSASNILVVKKGQAIEVHDILSIR